MSTLFSPLVVRKTLFRNRVWMSPMCQYSAPGNGKAGEWHFVHLGARAVGGVGLAMVEATAVTPEGRITPGCLGLWNDEQAAALAPIANFLKCHGAVPGIQLAHAGRKGSCEIPWKGGHQIDPSRGGWITVAPSVATYKPGEFQPRALDKADIAALVAAFAAAARRAVQAGFEVVELHFAHGYLVHQFLSPLSNTRRDNYGGDFTGRSRLALEIAHAVRAAIPDDAALFARLSATDWIDGGWHVDQSIQLSRDLKIAGVDLIDVSSGGLRHDQQIAVGPGFQVPFAEAIRNNADIPTAAVGLVTEPTQAETIVATGQADAVFLARALLRDPHWPLRAAQALGADITWPPQYARAKPFLG